MAIVRRGLIAADESLADLRQRARRRVEVTFADSDPARRAEPPAAFQVRERGDRVWRGELSGPAGVLSAWLAASRVEDLVVSPPDLEALFRGYYREEGDG